MRVSQIEDSVTASPVRRKAMFVQVVEGQRTERKSLWIDALLFKSAQQLCEMRTPDKATEHRGATAFMPLDDLIVEDDILDIEGDRFI